MKVTLQTFDGTCKFCIVSVDGKKSTVRQGKIGKPGTTTEKEHESKEEAEEHAKKVVATKKKSGFKDMDASDDDDKSDENPAPTKRAKRETTAKPAAKKATRGKKAAKKSSKKDDDSDNEDEDEKPEVAEESEEKGKKKTKAKTAAKKKNNNTEVPAAVVEVPQPIPVPPPPPKPTTIELAKDSPPITWQVNLKTTTYGLYVNDTHVYTGDEDGLVQKFDKEGNVEQQLRVLSYPVGVKCIVGDGPFIYVGCNDGSLYDITHGQPRFMCQAGFSQVYAFDIHNGIIATSDKDGNVALVNAEGETVWSKKDENGIAGWMCLKDDTGVYHGHTNGVTKRNLETGKVLWSAIKGKNVMFGYQDEKFIYACCGMGIFKLDKTTGEEVLKFSSGGPSCSVSKDGSTIVSSLIKVYDNAGNLRDEFNPITTPPTSMVSWNEREFYSVRDLLIKYDFSLEAVQKVKEGTATALSFQHISLEEIKPQNTVTEVTDTSGGILCECIKEDDKLRIRIISPGYNNTWNVQFPRAIREAGAKYIVEKIIDQGGFYRSWGDIKKIKV